MGARGRRSGLGTRTGSAHSAGRASTSAAGAGGRAPRVAATTTSSEVGACSGYYWAPGLLGYWGTGSTGSTCACSRSSRRQPASFTTAWEKKAGDEKWISAGPRASTTARLLGSRCCCGSGSCCSASHVAARQAPADLAGEGQAELDRPRQAQFHGKPAVTTREGQAELSGRDRQAPSVQKED